MVLHDVIGNRESKPRALSDGLGRKEWIEYPVENFGLYSGAIVLYVKERAIIRRPNRDGQMGISAGMSFECLDRVHEQVGCHSLDVGGMTIDPNIRIETRFDLEPIGRVRASHPKRSRDDLAKRVR